MQRIGVAIVGLGWWGRVVTGLLKDNAKLSVAQAVILCTPHSQYCEQTVRAASAKKHVFCEKPLALSRADALRAVAACNANGVALAVGHERRFEPPIQAPAGPMTATGIHLLDLSIGLLGPAESAYARVKTLGSQLSNGDTLAVLVGFENGSNALISAILATPFEGRFAVYGSEGWAEVRDQAQMIANISALEAVFRSAKSGKIERVEK